MKSVLCLFSLLLLPTVFCQLTWELVSRGNETTAPSKRQDMVLGYDQTRNQLLMFGGRNPQILGDTWIYNITLGEWREVTSSGPPARYSLVGGVSGDYFYISTGEGPNRVFFDDIWRLNLITEVWEEIPLPVGALRPEKRYGSAGGIWQGDNKFYIALGFSGSRRYNNLLSIDVTSNSTTGWVMEFAGGNPYNPSYPHHRCLHGGTMTNQYEVIIFGGCMSGGQTGGPCPARDSWRFDARRREWKQLNNCASARVFPTVAALPSKGGQRRAILYGGIETNFGSLKQVLVTVESPPEQVGVYNANTEEWTLRTTTGTIPVKRQGAAMATATDGIYLFGGLSSSVLNDIYLLRGDAMSADQASKDADCSPAFFNLIMLHGILMVAGWGCCLQWGAFIARYCKKNSWWFNFHRGLQVAGLLLAIGGLVCATESVWFDHLKFSHAIIGVVVMVLGLQQPFNGLIRPAHTEKGETKTLRRLIWEKFHHLGGRSALILALVNISLGVFFAVASSAVWITWFVYLCLLVLAYVIAELRLHWKDAMMGCRSLRHELTPVKTSVAPSEPSEEMAEMKDK